VAGSRGYRSYRGKGSKKKMVLAVILLLVILAALAVSLLQKYIVYDGSGSRQLEVPWQKEEQQEPEEPVELDLVIQPVEEMEEPLRGIALPVGPLSAASWDTVRSGQAQWNGAAITLKDSTGTVYYDFASAPHNPAAVAEDTAAALTEWLAGEMDTIARISCFRDPRAANADVEGLGLKNTGGYIFYDGSNSQWLDPAKPAARQYLCEIAKEAAELGFHEILLTDVSYPTEGKVDKIAYGEGIRQEHLQGFLREMRTVLEPCGVRLSVELPADVILTGGNDLAGLDLTGIAPLADRIYARILPTEAGACEAAVTAACADTEFVPILTAAEAEAFEQFLIQ